MVLTEVVPALKFFALPPAVALTALLVQEDVTFKPKSLHTHRCKVLSHFVP